MPQNIPRVEGLLGPCRRFILFRAQCGVQQKAISYPLLGALNHKQPFSGCMEPVRVELHLEQKGVVRIQGVVVADARPLKLLVQQFVLPVN